MSRRFKIERDYYDNGEMLYQKKHVTFKPGLTVLVGCNGCGKTTLMRQIRLQVEKDLKNQCVLNFNNEHDGGQSSIQKSLFYGDMKFVASGLTSSEGERIALNMQKIATQIGTMLQKYQNENEFWIFLDGIDSGFSVDAIVDLKRGLFDTIFETFGIFFHVFSFLFSLGLICQKLHSYKKKKAHFVLSQTSAFSNSLTQSLNFFFFCDSVSTQYSSG